MIITKKEKGLFTQYLLSTDMSEEQIKNKIRPGIFGTGFVVERESYKEFLCFRKDNGLCDNVQEVYDDDEFIEHDEEGDEIYIECIDVEASRVYSTNLDIDRNLHTKFRVAHYDDNFHLYSVAETGESVFLVTLNAYQMIKILNDEYYTERFYARYYESLQKP